MNQLIPPPITQSWIFFLVAAVTIVMALTVVLIRNVIHAALALAACFFGVAGIYVLLHAQFLAVAQVLVYVGDITVLILFALMLTRGMMRPHMERWGAPFGAGAAIAILLAGLMISYIWLEDQSFKSPVISTPLQSIPGGSYGIVSEFSHQMLTDYLLPFEVASGILLMALIGAIVIAREENPIESR